MTYRYDSLNRLAATDIVQYDYAGMGKVLARRFGNGTQLSYHSDTNDSGYDGINRTVQHRHTNANDQLIAGFEYAYDQAHNRRYEVDQFQQLADVYEYDSAYRLIRSTYRVAADNPMLQAIVNNETTNADVAALVVPNDAANDVNWMLDGVGNWVSRQVTNTAGSSAIGYQPNNMNEYDQIGVAAQTHDANGNLTSDGERRYHYDARNRLVRVSTLSGNTVASYTYDAYNRRARKAAGSDVTVFHYFGDQVMEERNLAGQVQRQFVYGRGVDNVLQMRTAANDYYYHDNSLGSIVALTDGDGQVVEHYDYDAYGVTTTYAADGTTVRDSSVVDNPYGFTGRRLDHESGFYYYRARYYSPEQARFIQRDPLGYVDGMGLYAYVGNNPVNWVDPFGEQGNPVIDSTWEALGHYFNDNSGNPVQLGPDTQQAITDQILSPDSRFENIRDGSSQNMYQGSNVPLDMTSDMYHLGQTTVDYTTTCSGGVCTTTYTVADGDGFYDPLADSSYNWLPGQDGQGSNWEVPGGTPYPYDPYVFTDTFSDPNVGTTAEKK